MPVLPAVAPLISAGGTIAGAGAAANAWGDDFLNGGQNHVQAHQFGENPNYNPNDFTYGGDPSTAGYDVPNWPGHPEFGVTHVGPHTGAMDTQVGRANAVGDQAAAQGQNFLGQMQAAQGRAAPTIDTTMANQSRGYEMGGLNQMGSALDLQRQAALGQTPSRAELLMRQGMNQAAADQASMVAGARGGGNQLAAMQRQAMGVGAQNQLNTLGQAGILRAQEMADARNAYMSGAGQYMGAAGSLRGQDFGQAQAQAQLAMQQRNANDAYSLGMGNLYSGTNQTQLGAGGLANNIYGTGLQGSMGRQNLLGNSSDTAYQTNAGIGQFNAQQRAAQQKSMMDLFSSSGQTAAGAASGASGPKGGGPTGTLSSTGQPNVSG